LPDAPLDHEPTPVEAVGVKRLQEWMLARIRELGATESEIARRAGMSRQQLNRLLHADRVTIPEIDLLDRLALALQVPQKRVRQVAAEAYGYVVSSTDEKTRTLIASIEELPEDRRRDLERLAAMYLQETREGDDDRHRPSRDR
jgi:transcriptional regulator with XRE-family HTH domain